MFFKNLGFYAPFISISFVGLFCLGLSWAFTDLSEFLELPISSISVAMMSFGAPGTFFIKFF